MNLIFEMTNIQENEKPPQLFVISPTNYLQSSEV